MGSSSVTSALEAAFVISPVVALAVAALSWFRVRQGRPWSRAVLASGVDILALSTVFPIIALTLLNPGSGGGISLVPFSDMMDSGLGNMTGFYQNGGNIALFMPLGVLLPLAWGQRFAGFSRVLAAATAVSVTVEALQYVLGTGHVASVDDVILNCCGALLGAALSWPWWRSRTRGGRVASVTTRASDAG